MLESMTGFATVQHREDGLQLDLRLRSVNSRFLDLRLRLPATLGRFEALGTEMVRASFARGKIDVDITVAEGGLDREVWVPDLHCARAVRAGLDEIRAALSLGGEVAIDTLVRAAGPNLFIRRPVAEDPADLERVFVAALTRGVAALEEARGTEGLALSEDLAAGAAEINRLAEAAERGCAGLVDDVRKRLHERLERLGASPENAEDTRRIEQEIMLHAERCDVHEELVRLRAHTAAFEQTRLRATGPCGKRLDFLLQEILREVNTLGSKVPRATVRGLVVDMKVQVEKLRQQVANVA